jgi:hypothetical protein
MSTAFEKRKENGQRVVACGESIEEIYLAG